MNTIENNKLIAEFMGLTIITDGISFFDTNYKPLKKYDSDWNHLMEVVEKIESLGYGFNFFFKKDKCYVSISNFESNVFVGANGVDYNTQPNKLEAVYQAVIKFINNTRA